MSLNGFRTDSTRSPLASIEVEIEIEVSNGNPRILPTHLISVPGRLGDCVSRCAAEVIAC